MSAAELREAATLIRSRARAACRAVEHDGAWSASWDHQVLAGDGARIAACFDSGLIAEHIAGMHPAVALAVADWLENAAEDLDLQAPDGDLRKNWDMRVHINADKALVVARAYLGRDA